MYWVRNSQFDEANRSSKGCPLNDGESDGDRHEADKPQEEVVSKDGITTLYTQTGVQDAIAFRTSLCVRISSKRWF